MTEWFPTGEQVSEPQSSYMWKCPRCDVQWHLPAERALMLQTQNTKADCCIMWFDKTIAWQRRALVILEVILSGGPCR